MAITLAKTCPKNECNGNETVEMELKVNLMSVFNMCWTRHLHNTFPTCIGHARALKSQINLSLKKTFYFCVCEGWVCAHTRSLCEYKELKRSNTQICTKNKKGGFICARVCIHWWVGVRVQVYGRVRARAGRNIPKETTFSCTSSNKRKHLIGNKSIRGNIKNL